MDSDPDSWNLELRAAERRLGLRNGYKFLFGPWSTRLSASVAFLSLKPGRAPAAAELRLVSDERGNSYRVEQDVTASPMTSQFLALAALLGQEPDRILAGVASPFRADRWSGLSPAQQAEGLALGRRFWADPLARPDLRLVIATSEQAAALACDLTGAGPDRSMPAGWGNLRLVRYRTAEGRLVLHLPHLSRFRLLSRPAARQALRVMLDLGDEAAPRPRPARRALRPAPSEASPARPETRSRRLPVEAATLLDSLDRHPDCRCEWLRMQTAVYVRGDRVGGLNRGNRRWYLLRRFVTAYGGSVLAERHGFQRREKPGHVWWEAQGPEAARSFREALQAMAGLRFPA